MWSAKLGTPCEFVLLNSSGRGIEGRDLVTVDAHHAAAEQQINSLRKMLQNSGPGGRTPLGARVREIGARLSAQKEHLADHGQKVYLVLVTDGRPDDDSEFMRELRHVMNNLPVMVVVRLCTNEDPVVDYYNQVEEDLELPLEVIDDAEGEATEIAKQGNGWFAYTLALHRIREGGTLIKIFDLLDERPLTIQEIALFAHLLLRSPDDPPFSSDPETLWDQVMGSLGDAPHVYCVRRQRLVSPIDASSFHRAIFPAQSARRSLLSCLRWLLCCPRRCRYRAGPHGASLLGES